MGRTALWLLFTACVAACKPARHEAGQRCLALPAAIREALTASPDGQSLYWLERTRNFNFDGELDATWVLVRYDLRTHQRDVLADHVGGPLRFVGGQLLVRQGIDTARVVLFGSDGHTQELTPTQFDVRDFEVMDSHSLAFLADGDGGRAIFTLDLSELRPYFLVDADILLSATGGKVFAQVDDDVVVTDARTHATSRTAHIKKSEPLGENLVYVDKGAVVLHSMASNAEKPVITTARGWKLVVQGDSLLARTRPEEDKSFAYLIEGEKATQLPTIDGGASILRVARAGKDTWALIGHNTMNYIGDLAETDAETDVCVLPAAGEIQLPTRSVPARYAERAPAMFDALAATSPDATLQFLEGEHEPTTVSIYLRKEAGGSDFVKMRKRTLEIHDQVTRLLGDPELETEVTFADRRRGIHRWKRDRMRDRVTVGMGDALLTEPADFDIETRDIENVRRDGKITCVGSVRNIAHRALANVDVRCSGNRQYTIHFDKLDDGETKTFSQSFDLNDLGELGMTVILVDGKPSYPRYVTAETHTEQLFELATGVYAATGLYLATHDITGDEIVVTLHAQPEFLDQDRAKQETAVKAAYDGYLKARGIFDMTVKPLRLHVEVERTETTIDYDGSLLERDD